MQLQVSDYLIIAAVIVAAVLVGLVYFSRRNYKKVIESQDFIEQNKTKAQIFVIDKKFEKPTPSNLPKMIYEQLPKASKLRKMPIVKAKVGPQIVTLMCDKPIYDILPNKKTVKVELAGLYIVSIVGVNLADKKKKTWREKMTLAAQGSKKKDK